MSLTPQEKAKIRAEEEAKIHADAARVKADEEAAYREAVRAELTTGRPPRQSRGSTATVIWFGLAGAAGIAAIVALVMAFTGRATRGAADAEDEPVDVALTLVAGGPVAPVAAPDWRPSELATNEYVISPDGKVKAVPGRGFGTFAEWRADHETTVVMDDPFPKSETLAELQARYRASPPDMSRPRLGRPGSAPAPIVKTPDDGAAVVDVAPPTAVGEVTDGLLRFVPPSSWLTVGIRRAGVQRSPALARLHALLASGLGEVQPLASIGGAAVLAQADELVYAAALAGDYDDDELMIAATTDSDALTRVLATLPPDPEGRGGGPIPWHALGDGSGVVVEPGRFAAARPKTMPLVLAARATDCIIWSGELSAMLRRVRDASTIYAVLHGRGTDQDALGRLVFGLEAVSVIGARVDVESDIGLSLYLSFPSAETASRALTGLEQKRNELRGSAEVLLLDRVQPALEGSILTLKARISEAELAGLLGRIDGSDP